MMRSNRIRAVDLIVREAAVGLEDALRWFYIEVAGLEEVPSDNGCPALVFQATQQQIEIRLVSNPGVEAGGFPIVIAVPSLTDASDLLAERSVAFETLSGVSWPDRRLATNDPAGNRVELKREWPYDPL